jgi:hypothetical protein
LVVGKIAIEAEKAWGRAWCGIRLSVALAYQVRYSVLLLLLTKSRYCIAAEQGKT